MIENWGSDVCEVILQLFLHSGTFNEFCQYH